MFGLFNNRNASDKLIKVVDIAFDGRNYIAELFNPLTVDGQIELFIFNTVYCWLYLQDNSLVKMNAENASQFHAIASLKAKELKESIEPEEFFELFRDRFTNYQEELYLVNKNRFTETEYFPIYFYRRIYHHPLNKNPMNDINQRSEEYYEGDMCLDYYSYQTNFIHDKLDKYFGEK